MKHSETRQFSEGDQVRALWGRHSEQSLLWGGGDVAAPNDSLEEL